MARHHTTSAHGPSQRQLRVGELIRRKLSEVLLRAEVHDPDLNRIPITVGEVRCSPDLRHATAFIMPLGGGQRQEALTLLRRHSRELRHLVSQDLTLKYAPDLRFELDETFDRMDETRRLLNEDTVRRDIVGDDGADEEADD
ncbi:30S ribosome-binding factor RbfA [Solirhodobacter olei]|uniref:30S ribosome-binding factor RbfA n=1 Tax=Solirhodobacter olei TaxID=2493082 RepID=UPI000FD71A88|nr:30S ribosome-binding factor RbfA [Solirhodobacter olei]